MHVAYLEHFLLQPGFIDNCDHWKNRNGTGTLQDVYDGRIWQQFMQVLTTSTCLALMLNVDWFQPYVHTCCSVGVACSIHVYLQGFAFTNYSARL